MRPFEAPYLTPEERQELANGLMDLAAWVMASDFPIPKTAITYQHPGIHVPSTYIDDDSFVKRAGTAARLIGGKVDKGELYKDGPFTLTRDFGGGVQFKFSIARDAVCESYVVTEMQDTYDQVPVDPDAEARVTELRRKLELELAGPTRYKPVRKAVEKTKYVCPPSLLQEAS